MAFTLDAFDAAIAGATARGASGRFVVALSGGLDSTVALHALLEAASTESVRAIHVDHGLHPDSVQWRGHCRSLCAALGVRFTDAIVTVRPQQGESPEDAARQARYRCLDAELGDGETLVTGHHADDQLETMLLQLLRGAGPAGLAAMPVLTTFGRGWLCRPLLGFRRDELARWAESRELAWLEDPSNREVGFDRNFLRHEVLPPLRRRWPAAAMSAVRSARHCGEALELMEALADADLIPISQNGCLDVAGVADLTPARQRNLLRRWMNRCGLTIPDARRLESILRDVIGARGDAEPEVRWPGGAVRRYRGRLHGLDAATLKCLDQPQVERSWDVDGALDLGPGMGRLRLVRATGIGIAARWLEAGPLQVRRRAGGEKIRLAGRTGRRSLKKLLQEAGVPPWWRAHIPIVWQGSQLLSVGDLWYAAEASDEGPHAWQVIWEDRPEFS